MTCYEHLRNGINGRLNSYFIALENNQTESYHKKHGRTGGLK